MYTNNLEILSSLPRTYIPFLLLRVTLTTIDGDGGPKVMVFFVFFYIFLISLFSVLILSLCVGLVGLAGCLGTVKVCEANSSEGVESRGNS